METSKKPLLEGEAEELGVQTGDVDKSMAGSQPTGEKSLFEIFNEHIQSGDCSALESLVAEHKTELMDIEGYQGDTLLHCAINAGFNKGFSLILSTVKELVDSRVRTRLDFIIWLDKRTGNHQLTALHIASYKGNMYAIKQLLVAGAKDSLCSKHGMNVFHFAAQNNQPLPIIYFYEQRHLFEMDPDDDGNTPLHWACHMGSNYSATFLLRYTPDLSKKNAMQMTPLHLAVQSCLSLGVTRLLLVLLFAGADRDATDSKGRRPIDLVLQAESNSKYDQIVVEDIKRILQQPTECLCLMLKVPIKKHYPSVSLIVYFLLFHLLLHLATFNAICSYPNMIPFMDTLPQLLITGSLFLLSLVFFTETARRDPGIQRPTETLNYYEIAEQVGPDNVCPYCAVIRGPRSKHCVICNKCVERYDHHCPWVNNCVGMNNHNMFLLLVFTLFADYTISCFIMAQLFSEFLHSYDDTLLVLAYEVSISSIFLITLSAGLLLGLAFGIVLILMLMYVHMGNFCQGRTTNERFGAQTNGGADSGCGCGNCCDFIWPRPMQPQEHLYKSLQKEDPTADAFPN